MGQTALKELVALAISSIFSIGPFAVVGQSNPLIY
jgi:hypothetical protein